MYIYCILFVHSAIHQWTLGLFPFFSYLWTILQWALAYKYIRVLVFSSFGYTAEWNCSVIQLYCVFCGTLNCFPQQHFTFPQGVNEGSSFPTLYPALTVFLLIAILARCKLVPHCGLTCICLMTKYMFMYWLVLCVSSLENYLIKFFAHFSIELFVFLL